MTGQGPLLPTQAAGAACILLFLAAVSFSGCITTAGPGLQAPATHPAPAHGLQGAAEPEPEQAPPPYSARNAAVNTSPVPLLLNDEGWEMAKSCGWTEANITESAALFQKSCPVKNLLADGWTIKGMRYNVNVPGSRCRPAMRPEASRDCDLCDDAGPTLVLSYKGLMEKELMAHPATKTVTGFSTTLPDGAGSAFREGSETILFRNGTVLYTFRNC